MIFNYTLNISNYERMEKQLINQVKLNVIKHLKISDEEFEDKFIPYIKIILNDCSFKHDDLLELLLELIDTEISEQDIETDIRDIIMEDIKHIIQEEELIDIIISGNTEIYTLEILQIFDKDQLIKIIKDESIKIEKHIDILQVVSYYSLINIMIYFLEYYNYIDVRDEVRSLYNLSSRELLKRIRNINKDNKNIYQILYDDILIRLVYTNKYRYYFMNLINNLDNFDEVEEVYNQYLITNGKPINNVKVFTKENLIDYISIKEIREYLFYCFNSKILLK